MCCKTKQFHFYYSTIFDLFSFLLQHQLIYFPFYYSTQFIKMKVKVFGVRGGIEFETVQLCIANVHLSVSTAKSLSATRRGSATRVRLVVSSRIRL
jgi:hypothetical protein